MFRDGGLRDWAALLRQMQKVKLNGGLIGGHVAPTFFDDMTQNGCQQRTLARSHYAGDQHKAVFRHSVIQNTLFNAQIFQQRRR